MGTPAATVAQTVDAAEGTYEANRVRMIYEGSDGEATQALYTELAAKGLVGVIALNLFRAQKCSARAKLYASGHYSTLAYGRKNWSIDQLADVLAKFQHFYRWGWGTDPEQPKFPWVIYIDLPQGQVSFHAVTKGTGPMYPGVWDGVKDASAERILAFTDSVLHPRDTLVEHERELRARAIEQTGGTYDPLKESGNGDKKRSTRRRPARRRVSRPKRRR